jgi:hypothetical protein
VEESITDFNLLKRGSNRTVAHERDDPFSVLDPLYDADQVEALKTMYALRSLEIFATRTRKRFYNPHSNRANRGYPNIGDRGGVSEYEGGKPKRYPNVGLRGRPRAKVPDAAQIDERRLRKARGLTLSRDEEISIRFDAARGF